MKSPSNRRFLYSVKTIVGNRYEVEAVSAEEALTRLGLKRAMVRRWYPFPLKALLTAEEKEAQNQRIEMLRSIGK